MVIGGGEALGGGERPVLCGSFPVQFSSSDDGCVCVGEPDEVVTVFARPEEVNGGVGENARDALGLALGGAGEVGEYRVAEGAADDAVVGVACQV
jgi:hypothetical protein